MGRVAVGVAAGVTLAVLATLVPLGSTGPAAAATGATTPAAAPAPPPREAEPIPGRYVVTLADRGAGALAGATRSLTAEHGGRVLRRYTAALRGYAAAMTAAQAEALRADPRVARVEPDVVVRADWTDQADPPWGLDRIDQRALPLDAVYGAGTDGSGVTAYVIDTGIRVTHEDFGGRASVGVDLVGDGRGGIDCNGHGTHVAGTIGGRTHGVAKGVALVAVRVMACNGEGSLSSVLAGVDWVTAHHSGPSVANMSLGTMLPLSTLNAAVARSVASGVAYTVSAGNWGDDACNGSPASEPSAVTVAALGPDDTRPSWSSYGRCVDLFAPGAGVTSAWHTGDTATFRASGTSMAAPHAAGALALLAGLQPTATPAALVQRLTEGATAGVVRDAGSGSPNRLLHTGDVSATASVTVTQDSVVDAPQDFAYEVTCPTGPCDRFTLDDDADPARRRKKVGRDVPPGTYTVTQAPVAGWTLTRIDCDGPAVVDLAARRVTVTLTVAEQTRCTFVDEAPSVTVVQDADPADPQDFAFTGCGAAGCGPLVLDDDPDPGRPSSAAAGGLVPGRYTVTQAATAGWPLTALACDTGETVDLPARRATIDLGPLEHVTCTFTNASATIRIVQDTVPDQAQDYPYTGCLGAGCAGFTLDDDPADPTQPASASAAGLVPGTYTVTQGAVAGHQLASLRCDTGELVDLTARRATIDLTPGERVTCTFTNRRTPPPNDDFAAAQVLTGAGGQVTATNVDATVEAGEPTASSTATVWFRWTATHSGPVVVGNCGTTTNAASVQVFTGTVLSELVLEPAPQRVCASGGSDATFTAVSGTSYAIRVGLLGTPQGPYTLRWG